ncbi:S-DNA-T family DNA segregation ATPase FtsK/SpoIIIE [Microbacterium terrae]|uniref:ESX-1 secretion system protein EccCa1 n=1 Tax=Microbacterium terrae TaxID=69369 RepID=A0A0M2HI23_9MICO|nr:FtsK/SpoIIIE domain-containing protein [Microbacterium terrae]KJL43955.1 ESX-1 secretion system protein EccCa1 [Microbacterium terrae]MBP1077837.1 S-DNA-T family DNA segregation ATPase FtsK/SpoIIIE [Microbacterium terrae]GLK00008.1 hypothetical protein GCM10017594_32050 [Microbacterium terrae]
MTFTADRAPARAAARAADDPFAPVWAVGGGPDDEPLVLPAAWEPAPRAPLPLLASVVPIVGAVVLWLVTGSMIALWLAALAPLLVVATTVDARRAARRDRRAAQTRARREREAVRAAVERRHDAERAGLWRQHPDVRALAADPDAIWRVPDGDWTLVVGSGEGASAVRVRGGEGDTDSAAVRAAAARLTGSPITVSAAEGVAVTGDGPVAAAVHRALVLQLCLAHAPGEMRVEAVGGDIDWVHGLPHAQTASGARAVVIGRGEAVPDGADIVLALRGVGESPPPRCAAVLDVADPDAAILHRRGGAVRITPEAISRDQARHLADHLVDRAERLLGWTAPEQGAISLGELLAEGPGTGAGLAAVIGRIGAAAAVVDLVADGPHAIVAGVTGSGKSELLITWITAMCAERSPDEVAFLLADFKGGTAFDSLAALPHVTGVITDLDGDGARRAIESLRAEIRRREAAIARVGAREVSDPRVAVPRLVVVVDEFAALVGDHPELAAVFGDVAARGRALGVHLVLGTQRAAGVIREGLLANCPLRISLRVADPADSRFVIGGDEAAGLPGGVAGRGQAFLRRAGDARAVRVRVALTAPADIAAVAQRHASTGVEASAASRPWLPPLPERIALSALEPGDDPRPGALPWGLTDEPERQQQPTVALAPADRALLVLGGPGSGRSAALDAVGAGADVLLDIPADPEAAWDAITRLWHEPPARGSLVVFDDLDALIARFPPDHAAILVERIESVIRSAGSTGALVAASARRLTGPVARMADLFPRRLILGLPTRTDHIAAGGDGAHYLPQAPPGRGRIDGVAVQVALAPRRPAVRGVDDRPWAPTATLTGLVARRSPITRAALESWQAGGCRVLTPDEHSAATAAAGRSVVWAEPDEWQRHWRLLAELRGDHALVVDAGCASELRTLAGVRDAPPYCEPGRRRAWLLDAGADPVRIVLPSPEVRSERAGERLVAP